MVVGGHSFGGTTTICSALADKRIKAAITEDPFVIMVDTDESVADQYNLGALPFQALETENFPATLNTDPYGKREEFISVNTQGNNQEWHTVKGHGHMHFCDSCLYNPELVQMNNACEMMPMTGKEMGL